MFGRRSAVLGSLAGLALGPVAPALAQSWPTRPVRIVVTFPPGGSSDIVARVMAEALTPILGQRVVVDNRPGAGGTLAAAHVAQSAPDGYTLMLSNTAPLVTSPPLYASPGYDPQRGFTNIIYLGYTPMVVVSNLTVPATDLAGLQAWMKAQPNPVTYGTSGTGSVGHIVGVMWSAQTGIPLNHAPYRGSAPMQVDLLGGSIPISFDTLPESVENIRAGRIRAYGVTAATRQASVPNVPTVAEAGVPGLLALNWMGLSGPAGLPPAITEKLFTASATALQSRGVLDRMASVGITPGNMTQPEFAAFVTEQIDTMGATVRAMGIRND